MDFTLFDEPELRARLMPFTAIRPVSHLRLGIFLLYEKWELHLKGKAFFSSADYLQPFFPDGTQEWNVNASVLPDQQLVRAIQSLSAGESLVAEDGTLIAYRGARDAIKHQAICPAQRIRQVWDLFRFNGEELRRDFEWVVKERKRSKTNDPAVVMYRPENIFIEEGASVKACIINAETGPVYIAKGAEVQEGTLIRGGFALCEGAVAAMGSKFRGDCTVGPYCKVGGEVNNTVFIGYSNKGHDGYIGNSVVGEWCNLAAATNVSNMKNNHSEVKVYDMSSGTYEATGLSFCGVFFGDYSRCGIGTTLNTGSVVGFGANLFDTGFPPKFIPSFSWGTPQALQPFRKKEWFDMAEQTRLLKKQTTGTAERQLLEEVWQRYNTYHLTSQERAV